MNAVQLLPVFEMEHAHNSPYAALTAMAIDPVFLGLADQPDFVEAGGEDALSAEARDALVESSCRALLGHRGEGDHRWVGDRWHDGVIPDLGDTDALAKVGTLLRGPDAPGRHGLIDGDALGPDLGLAFSRQPLSPALGQAL